MKKSLRFAIVDAMYIALMIIPILSGIVLKVLTQPATEGIEIHGARIFFTIKLPLQDFPITESQINSMLVIVAILGLCLYMTHGITKGKACRRHLIAEWIVEKVDSLVKVNMGDYFAEFSPFICSILGLSVFSSLLSLLGLYPPTSDFSIVCGWSVLVFILITHFKLKGGAWNYVKGFGEPFLPFASFNVVSEFATPIAMSFRHYGNVLSGTVIATLVGSALQGLSASLLGGLPGFLGKIPLLQVGIPAILSAYFDVFSGCLQAFIFAMLTMLYVATGFPEEQWRERLLKQEAKKKQPSKHKQKHNA